MNPPVVLRIYQNDKLISVRQFLHEEQIVIGQPSSEAQVTIDDKEISPIHALIEKRGEAYYIADLGSQSGTLLNGVPILDERLQPGDQISVGKSKIEFFIGVPKPKAPPPRTVDSAAALSTVPNHAPSVAVEPTSHVLPVFGAVVSEINPTIQKVIQPVSQVDLQPAPENIETPVATLPQVQVNLPDTSTSMGAIELAPSAEASPIAAVTSNFEKSHADKIEGIVRVSSKNEHPILPQQPVVNIQSKANKHTVAKTGKKHRWTKSFAPPSRVSHIHEVLKPSKGTVIEVSVAWHERVISTHHFTEKKIIYVGSDSQADIIVPTKSSNKKIPLVQIDSLATVFIPQGQDSEVVKGNSIIKSADLQKMGRLQTVGAFSKIALEQGELIKMSFGEGLFLIVRYVSHTPRPLGAPFFDLSGPEATTIFAAVVLSALLGLYSFINPPQEVAIKQELIKANFVVEIPVPKAPQPVLPPPTPVEPATPPPTPTKVVEQKTQPTQTKVAEKSKEQAQAPNPKESATNQTQPGGGSQQALKNRDTKIKSNQPSASVRQGGAIKTSTKEGSQAKSQTKDISKSGIFSVFGSGGQKKETDQGYDGAGGLAGLAESATGAAGQSENRAGEGLGGKFKDTGASGRGKSNVGVSGISINTKGRGGGDAGYGTGSLGGRKGISVQVGGSEAEFKGTIDREAVRRVVRAHQREIQLCYERALNRDPGKSGKLVLSWNVGEQGRVLSANTVRSSTTMQDSDDISNCILSKLRTWKFPEPPRNEAYEVAYPFVFAPGT